MSEPVPQRIGDAERDRAVDCLREHLTQGRLDQAEFEERLDTALAARTSADLDPLFADLPAPKPGVPAPPAATNWPAYPAASSSSVAPTPPAAPVPAPSGGGSSAIAMAVGAAVWPLWLLAMFAFGSWGSLWWTVFIPIMVSSIVGQRHGRHRSRHRQIGS